MSGASDSDKIIGWASKWVRQLRAYRQAAFVVTDMDLDDPDDLVRWAEQMMKSREMLRESLREAMKYCEATTGERGELVGSAVPAHVMQRWRDEVGAVSTTGKP